MTKLVLTSDLHGSLPDIPECDILLIGGDVCPMENHSGAHQLNWLDTTFRNWLKEVPASSIVGIAGNHDFVFENNAAGVESLYLPWTYLKDAMTVVEGISIYGFPWVPNLRNWAFHGGMDCANKQELVDLIPEEVDILLSHGPINGYGDKWYLDGRLLGDLTLDQAIKEGKIRTKLLVCGHVHEGYGFYPNNHIKKGIYNVSHMTVQYEPINPVIELEW